MRRILFLFRRFQVTAPALQGSKRSSNMYAPSLSSRQGIISLASAFLLALCLALTGCDINISTNGFPSAPSSSTGSQCQANCVTGTGVNGVSVFVEPNAGESPIVDAIDGAKKSVWLEMYILSDTNVIRALEDRKSTRLN